MQHIQIQIGLNHDWAHAIHIRYNATTQLIRKAKWYDVILTSALSTTPGVAVIHSELVCVIVYGEICAVY